MPAAEASPVATEQLVGAHVDAALLLSKSGKPMWAGLNLLGHKPSAAGKDPKLLHNDESFGIT